MEPNLTSNFSLLDAAISGNPRAGCELSRIVITRSLGLAGLFDVADTAFSNRQNNRDTGRTLGVYKIEQDPVLSRRFYRP